MNSRAVLAVFVLFSGCAITQMAPTQEMRQALAPTGKLRVAFPSVAHYVTRDPATGEQKGPAMDLGSELAGRLGVPFQPIPYANVGGIMAGEKSGEWDVVLLGINAERAAAIDFSAPYMEVEQVFVVGPGTRIATMSEMDKAGIRIGVFERGGADVQLSKTLMEATLVRANNVSEFRALWQSEKVDVIAVPKAGASDTMARRPGSRILDPGPTMSEWIGIGVPKGRPAIAAAYVEEFVQRAKAEGLVTSAIERAGLRGVGVAPPSSR